MVHDNPERMAGSMHANADNEQTVREAEAQHATEQRFEKYIKRKRRILSLGKSVVATTVALNALLVAPYLADVRNNMAETADAKPTINVMSAAIDESNKDTATIFFQGFNAHDANYFVHEIGPGYQKAFDSQLWSVSYNNAPLNTDALIKITRKMLAAKGITKAKFVMYSQGSTVGTTVAVDTIKNTSVDVEDLFYLSGVATSESLTDHTKEQLGVANNLSWIPWIEYSTPFRIILEGVFYQDDLQKEPFQTSNGIAIRYTNGDMTSNIFLASQINAALNANVPGTLSALKDLDDIKHKTNITYVSSLPDQDTVVYNDIASEAICEVADELEAPCTTGVVNSEHGRYYTDLSVKEYDRIFQELSPTLSAYTSREAARQALALYGYTQESPLKLSYR